MTWDSANITSRIVLDVAIKQGITDVVCSPGSRNSPLLIASEARKQLRKHIITDERSAAFFSLGIALISRRPVMLICTSGSAVLNYAPAVAEAFYQGIPLIIVSADRPVEWIDQDDSQTIRQNSVLNNIVKRSYDIPVAPSDSHSIADFRWFCNRTVNEAILTARTGKSGPVHLNVQLAPPLTEIVCCKSQEQHNTRIIQEFLPEEKISPDQMTLLAEKACGKKIMLVGGFHVPDMRLNKAVNRFGTLPYVTVFTETIANIHSENGWTDIDSVLPLADDTLLPDIVISFGGALVSRNLKEYIRNHPTIEHWSLGHSNTLPDCFQSLTVKIDVEPASFLLRLGGMLRTSLNDNSSSEISTYNRSWTDLRIKARSVHDAFMNSAPWCDLSAFSTILSSIPSSWNLFLSNGTPIRYAQLFRTDFHGSFCNRGVSGIDGCTSTAIGGAIATQTPTALITGDLSFSYDIGALGIPEAANSGIVIFVINNGGGGIFRFIKSTSHLNEALLEKYFCVNPNLKIDIIAKAFGFDYLRIDKNNKNQGRTVIKNLCENPREHSVIIEVITDGVLSAETLRNYFNIFKQS